MLQLNIIHKKAVMQPFKRKKDKKDKSNLKQRFFDNLPNIVACSDSYKDYGIKRLPKDLARYKKEIQINPSYEVRQIVLDCDYSPDGAFDEYLPLPNLVTVSERNHFHAIFFLKDPVFNKDSRSWDFLNDLRKKLTDLFNADPSYSFFTTHNPFAYNCIELHDKPWTLNELSQYCTNIDRKTIEAKYINNDKYSRNRTIFNKLLYNSTNLLRKYRKKGDKVMEKVLIEEALRLYDALPDKSDFYEFEVLAIARSVFKTYKHEIQKYKDRHPYKDSMYERANKIRARESSKRKALFLGLMIKDKVRDEIMQVLGICKSTYYKYRKEVLGNLAGYFGSLYINRSTKDRLQPDVLSNAFNPLLIRHRLAFSDGIELTDIPSYGSSENIISCIMDMIKDAVLANNGLDFPRLLIEKLGKRLKKHWKNL